jgi:hypothetical protein
MAQGEYIKMSDDKEAISGKMALKAGIKRLRRSVSPRAASQSAAPSIASVDGEIAAKLSAHLSKGNVEKVANFFVEHGSAMARNPITRTLKGRELNMILGERGPGKRMDLKTVGETAKLFQKREGAISERNNITIASVASAAISSPYQAQSSKREEVKRGDKIIKAMNDAGLAGAAPAVKEELLKTISTMKEGADSRTAGSLQKMLAKNGVDDSKLNERHVSNIAVQFKTQAVKDRNSLVATMESGRAAATLEQGRSVPVRSGPIPAATFRPIDAGLQTAPATGNAATLSSNAKPLIGAVNEKLAAALSARAERDNPAPERTTVRGGQDTGALDPHLIRRSSSASSIGSQFSDASSKSNSSTVQKVRETVSAKIASVKPTPRGLTSDALAAHNKAQNAQKATSTSSVSSRSPRSNERDRAAVR